MLPKVMSAPATCTYVAVVEDDESLCRSLSRLLRVSGMIPVTYFSAEAFLDDTKRPQFDCLILDIQLDGMSGIELSEQLSDSGSTTPVIFLTALEDPDVYERALRTRCSAYLRKSEPAESLLAAIGTAIRSNNHGSHAP